MAKKKKVPPGQQTRPGEAVQKKKPLPGKAFKPAKKPTQYRPGEGPQPGGKGKRGPTPKAPIVVPRDTTAADAAAKAAADAAAAAAATAAAEAAEAAAAAAATSDERRRILEKYVRSIGLPASCTDFLLAKMNTGELPEDADEFDYVATLSDEPSFKARFPTIVEQYRRVSAGDQSIQIMMPGEIIGYERQVRAVADDFGLSSWVTTPEQISKLILNGVDVDEATERINLAGYAAMQAPKTFRDAFLGKFGLTEGNLAGYFLDPSKEEGEIRKMVSQGNIMSAALTHGFGNDWRVAQRLFDRGFVPADSNGMVGANDAMSGFARAALSGGLSGGLGGTADEDTRVDAAFGDTTAASKVESVLAQRAGRFNQSGGAAESQSGITGLGKASSS